MKGKISCCPDIAQTLDVRCKIKSNILAPLIWVYIYFPRSCHPQVSVSPVCVASDFRYPETFTYSRLNSVRTSNYFHPQTLNGRLHCFPKGVLFEAVYSSFPRIIWSVFFLRKLISRFFCWSIFKWKTNNLYDLRPLYISSWSRKRGLLFKYV